MKHTMKNYLRNLAGAFTFAALAAMTTMMLSGTASAKEDPIYTAYFSNLAAGGYDVTAYFTESKPVKGKKAFKTKHEGAEWLFASKENLDKFTADPQKYAPQYGGYCAWAVSQGNTAKGDPLLWTVHADKLYLNYNQEVNKSWRADIDNLIEVGDQNWPSVLK